MKKICIITTISTTMKRFVLETAKHLHNECGYDVTLICSPDDSVVASFPEYLHYIPVNMPRGMKLSGFKSIKVFRKIFREQKFDLVQYSTPNASCYASIAARKEKVPLRLYCQWGIRYVGFFGIKRKIFKMLEKLVCKNSTHIRTVSPLNMKYAIDEGLYPENKAKVVGNGGTIGVDMNIFNIDKKAKWREDIRKQHKISDDDFVFGFVGRVTVDKGNRELLEAFKILTEKTKNTKLMLIGNIEGADQSLLELVDWAKKSERVIITGKIENSDINKYYSAMDVLAHPTYREGFGMVIQEAGAMGVPVITTRIPGASEVMVDGESCVLVDAKDKDQLARAMLELSADIEKTKNIGNSAYIRTKELYERNIMLSHQKDDYMSLLRDETDIERVVLSDKDIRNFNYPYNTEIKKISPKDLMKFNHNEKVVAVAGSRAMAIEAAKMDLPSLKLFQLTSAGFDNVPCEKFAEQGVAVANAGSVYSVPIAETVVYGILQMAKKIRKNPNNRHFKITRGYNTITEIKDKRILIMGAGNIGTAIAERLIPFGAVVDGYDPYCIDKPQYKSILRTRDELKANLYKYDYIVSTLPDNDETKRFIDKELFDAMSKNAVIVNVGRRAVFNEDDFYKALKSRKIGGAVLDMFEKIPNPITNKFRRLKNVIVWPGVSAISAEVNERLKNHMYKNIISCLNGEKIENVINGGK